MSKTLPLFIVAILVFVFIIGCTQTTPNSDLMKKVSGKWVYLDVDNFKEYVYQGVLTLNSDGTYSFNPIISGNVTKTRASTPVSWFADCLGNIGFQRRMGMSP